MIFYFLTSIVFIAELIITMAVVMHLIKLDKNFKNWNTFIEESKSDIKDIMSAAKKVSENLVSLSPIIINKIKSTVQNIIMSQIKNLLAGIIFFVVKKEVEKNIVKY